MYSYILNISELHGYENEESLMADYGRMSSNYSSATFGPKIIAIIFDEDNNNKKHLKYKLRTTTFLNTKELFPEFESRPYYEPKYSLECKYLIPLKFNLLPSYC